MHRGIVLAVAVAALLPCARSTAEIIDLGGGWQAELEAPVSLTVTYVDLELRLLVLEKFADVQGLAPLDITFTQTSDGATDFQTATAIIITKATIVNSTAVDWTEFQDVLIGDVARFDPVASAGFAAAPFDTAVFSPSLKKVLFTGGTLATGETWTPGDGPGGLRIDIDLSSPDPASFVLRQRPVPTPGALALLSISGLALAPRRRRR
jgi:hypothetical protein